MHREQPAERDPNVVRRELRIERATVALVLHGYRNDPAGIELAAVELVGECATLPEIIPALRWALARIPHGAGEPDALTDHLVTLYQVRD